MAVCDICNTSGHGTLVSSEQMRQAVFGRGFDPFALGRVAGLAALMGGNEAYEDWKTGIVAQDTSDWNVCSGCMGQLTSYLEDAPRAAGVDSARVSANPLIAETARAEAEEKYAEEGPAAAAPEETLTAPPPSIAEGGQAETEDEAEGMQPEPEISDPFLRGITKLYGERDKAGSQ